jgi:L-ribulose-5-phosphate 4-epimerase
MERDARLDPDDARMSAAADRRVRVAATNAAINDGGLVTLSFGNVSGVDRDAGVLVIKPSGVPYAELRPEMMVVIDLEGGQVVDGELRPSTDTPTHRFLYRTFPEIGGVVHTHSSNATAWAQAGRSIPCLGTTHADYFRGSVPVSRPLRPEEIAGEYEWETGRVIAETLAPQGRTPTDAPAVLVGSHGPFAWGTSPEAAVEVAIALEAVAAMASATIALEANVEQIGEELLGRHFDRKHGDNAYYGQRTRA